MSRIQRLFARILLCTWAKDMKAESQGWHVQCPFGYKQVGYELGGIRWKAAGNKSRRPNNTSELRSHSLANPLSQS